VCPDVWLVLYEHKRKEGQKDSSAILNLDHLFSLPYKAAALWGWHKSECELFWTHPWACGGCNKTSSKHRIKRHTQRHSHKQTEMTWLCWYVWEKASSRYQINQQAGRCKWLAYMEPAAWSQNSCSTVDRWPEGPHQHLHNSPSFHVSPALSEASLSLTPCSISVFFSFYFLPSSIFVSVIPHYACKCLQSSGFKGATAECLVNTTLVSNWNMK